MPASIGVNLRVTGHCKQGGRKYMEDYFSVAYQQTEDEKDLEYAFFGIFDGHGGSEAATYAKEHLMESIVRQRLFWSDKDEDVLKAIKEGFIATHLAMWKEQENWPKTATGLPSTAGTTASIAFIRRGKIFIGHVGDSGIVLGYQNPGSPKWEAKRLTCDHKPENIQELTRIESCGGKVITKSGVPRVVWYRPHIGHKGPITRSTPHDEIPFLAVARSLGDLWSYNSANNEFIVSPEPDTTVINIDTERFRCLIFGTDGLWNMINPSMAVSIVQTAEQHNAISVVSDNPRIKSWINPSMNLVECALQKWCSTKMRADNTSVVTLMLDPPGPPRAQVIRNAHKSINQLSTGVSIERAHPMENTDTTQTVLNQEPPRVEYPENGLEIVTRYEDVRTDIPNLLSAAESMLHSLPKENRYTEECLDKFQKLFEHTLGTNENLADSTDIEVLDIDPSCPANISTSITSIDIKPSDKSVDDPGEKKSDSVLETIQSNVVSSSSDSDKMTKRGRGRPSKGRTSLPDKLEKPEIRHSSRLSELNKKAEVNRTRGRPSKRERNTSDDENTTDEPAPSKLRRSRSLGPRDLQGDKLINKEDMEATCTRTRSRGSSTSVINTSPQKKLKPGRPHKRERNESDEENVSKERPTKKLIRSRSLGPRDIPSASLSDRKYVSRHSERNLRERNTNSDVKQRKSRGSSTSSLTRNTNHTQTRNQGRKSIK